MRLAIHGQIWICNYEQNELNHVEFESQLFTCLNIYEIRIRTECGDMNRVNTLAHCGAAATARGCYSQVSQTHTHTRNVSVFIDCCCIRVARVTRGHVKRLQRSHLPDVIGMASSEFGSFRCLFCCHVVTSE